MTRAETLRALPAQMGDEADAAGRRAVEHGQGRDMVKMAYAQGQQSAFRLARAAILRALAEEEGQADGSE